MAARALIALALASCTSADGELRASIVGGTADAGDPAVVAIAHRRVACGDPPAVFCSGVLVAPRVVLTAAHCLDGIASRGALEVIFGATAAAPTQILVVQATQVYGRYVPATGDGDLAALLLADDPGVAPLARPSDSVAALVAGAPLRAVGFGVSGATSNDPGVKRAGTLALGQVRAASFDATPAPTNSCIGDSGGPVLATIGGSEQLVGLTSRGDAACASSAINARVDPAQAPFVDPFVSASTGAPLGWAGTPAITAITCAVDTDCPALMTCLDQPSGKQCGLPWLGDGAFAGSCASAADCAPGARCAQVWPDGADACHCFASAIPPPPGGDAGLAPPPAGGSCATGDAPAPWIALAALLVRRRKIRAPRRSLVAT